MINTKIKTDLLNEYNKRKTTFNAKLFQKVMQKWEVYRTKILNGNFQLDEYTNLKDIAPNYLMHFLIYDKECESVLGNSNVQNMQHTMLKRNSKTSDWYLNKTRKFPLNASADRTAAENYFDNYILPLLTNIVNSCSTISTLHHFTRTNSEWEDFINKNPLHKIIVLESLYLNNSQYNIYCNVMPFYTDKVLDDACGILDISTNGLTTFEKMHTIMDVIYSELNVLREPETVVIMWQILWDMISPNSKVTSSTSKIESSKDGETEEIDEAIDSIGFNAGAYNKIFYGVPGCGKSWHIEHEVLDKDIFANCQNCKESNTFRTIFYQDYSHADFVGQYMPKRINGQVEYTFVPKVFTKALERAYQKPEEPVVLIIEEINRGDAASIFGDIFQLLDRDKSGKSEYEIDCDEIVDYLSAIENKNEIITKIVGKNGIVGTNKIYIPSNLYLLATMNTCDQNVFALDTAFKRRWNMEEIPNEFKGSGIENMLVPYDFGGTKITWEKFVEVVNEQIVENSDEFFGDDRQIGCFFVDDTCLLDPGAGMDAQKAENFAYKVISYLWNDVAKLNRTEWFSDVKTLHDAIDGFKNNQKVFADKLYNELIKP